MQTQEPPSTELIEDDETAGWILTYADLVTLLLVFFVLLFSISSMNLEKFRYAIASIQANLGESRPVAVEAILGQENAVEPVEPPQKIKAPQSRENDILEEFAHLIRRTNLGDNIILESAQGKIRLQIIGTVLFDSGQAAFLDEARPILAQIARIVKQYPEYNINIKGHTDNIPIQTRRFPSNWELSSIRATTVLKYLITRGIDPNRMTATGYADLLPVAPNDTEKNRTKNRRVEFVLEKTQTIF